MKICREIDEDMQSHSVRGSTSGALCPQLFYTLSSICSSACVDIAAGKGAGYDEVLETAAILQSLLRIPRIRTLELEDLVARNAQRILLQLTTIY